MNIRDAYCLDNKVNLEKHKAQLVEETDLVPDTIPISDTIPIFSKYQ